MSTRRRPCRSGTAAAAIIVVVGCWSLLARSLDDPATWFSVVPCFVFLSYTRARLACQTHAASFPFDTPARTMQGKVYLEKKNELKGKLTQVP